MPKIIKLENINFDRQTHKEEYVEEYVCSSCRHLVKPTDETCWQCGEKLKPSGEVEHCHKGKQLNESEFQALKKTLGL